ncbi:MAG TPA: pyruvate:ferredoxin (flavodoxin) oxidoreductase [Planctomycetota bacterium]
MPRRQITIDGNEAAASVAFRSNEVIAIYPITPSSTMGELSDEWAARKMKNVWGTIPRVVEMQSEGGAAGAVHGSLQAGALTTTFTASQGLLLMIPNMYKIAGELTSYCMHVTARALAAHALSIFGDHGDVMACRQTGFALLASNSPQEAHDMAMIGQAATLKARVPFLHFFDGFRTSHQVDKIEELTNEDIQSMLPEDLIAAHRQRALTPDHPVLRGTAQNPDVFFQAREAANSYYDACAGIVQQTMDQFAKLTGRKYHLFDYVGHPQAERVIVIMCSGAEAVEETVEYLIAKGEKVGLLKVRLYRPFSIDDCVKALPQSVKSIAVLDRTKEPGAPGEPLFLDVVNALEEARATGVVPVSFHPNVVGGRYGLGSKEFTPAMIKGVYDELKKAQPKRRFSVGIIDDVTHTSLPFDPEFDIEPDDCVRAVFFGLGADGTVGANKNSIKIIGEETEQYAQGYFVYDSKKSGAITISHLRFGKRPIRSSYLVRRANFVGCHQPIFLEKYDVLSYAAPGAVFLLNTHYAPDQVWESFPREVQQALLEKKCKLYVIDAYKVAKDTGMGVRINTIMQTCFFAISGVLPKEEAIEQIKKAIKKTYGRKGEEIVKRNFAAVDHTLAHLFPVTLPTKITATRGLPPAVSDKAPDFVKKVTSMMMTNQGDLLPVSAFPVDGTWETGTTKWEKRNIALDIPIWEPGLCIQCNKCAMVCPHAAIRPKVYGAELLAKAPKTFKSADYKTSDFKGSKFTIQVAAEDCTGCSICVMVCPAKDKTNPSRKAINMAPQAPVLVQERENFDFFLDIPEVDRTKVKADVKGSQLLEPLFEYSGACAACGETPYIKLLTQLFGDRMLAANATGCSSIYSGNLPTTPYTKNKEGRGPAWNNSLFEDNAEFGLGMRLALDKHNEQARERLTKNASAIGDVLVKELLEAKQSDEAGIAAQRVRVAALKDKLATINTPDARWLSLLADYLVRKTVWIIGGDGWAYDIGYGGLDHVLASGADINVLVLDTEVYSNTGGQASKSTPIGAAAKFAAAGKAIPKKDLGMIAMAYGSVYVSKVAFGARDAQTVRAFVEADSYEGPSLMIAYSHCIAHGYDLARGLDQQKLAVESASWPLYRYDPRRTLAGENPLQLDSQPGKVKIAQYMQNEARFRMVEQMDPERYKTLLASAQAHTDSRFALYQQMAASHVGAAQAAEPPVIKAEPAK